jgi:hypothetical protein
MPNNFPLIVIGIIYLASTFIIPQETLDKYEWFGLVFFIAPYSYLVMRAILKADQAPKEDAKNE